MLCHSLAWRKLRSVDRLSSTYEPPAAIQKYFPGGWHYHDKGELSCKWLERHFLPNILLLFFFHIHYQHFAKYKTSLHSSLSVFVMYKTLLYSSWCVFLWCIKHDFIARCVWRVMFLWCRSVTDGRPVYILRIGQMDVKGLLKSVSYDSILRHVRHSIIHSTTRMPQYYLSRYQ